MQGKRRDFDEDRKNVQVVKDFFAAIGSDDKQRLLSLVTGDIEWIIPGEETAKGPRLSLGHCP
jgi:ketosteroid isomerase-like protein